MFEQAVVALGVVFEFEIVAEQACHCLPKACYKTTAELLDGFECRIFCFSVDKFEPREEGKMITPEEVARIVARGIAKRKRLCLMEIEGRATNFVKKFAPAFLDKMFYWVMSKEPDSPFK